MRLRYIGVAVLFILALTKTWTATQDRSGAHMDGVVTDKRTEEPIDGVQVTVIGHSGITRREVTDGSGRFGFENLDAGGYTVSFSRKGFTTTEHHRTVTLTSAQNMPAMRFELVKTSAITGRVVDQAGAPVSSTTVIAIKPDYVGGRRVITADPFTTKLAYERTLGYRASQPTKAQSDENGQYRLFDLEPGEYYIAVWNVGTTNTYGGASSPIFYPGVDNPDAAIPVVIRDGTDISAIDIKVSPLQLHSARLNVVHPAIAPFDCSLGILGHIKQFVLVRHTANFDIVPFTSFANEDRLGIREVAPNSWVIPRLPPGSYDLFYSPCVEQRLGLVGRLSFDVTNRDVEAGTLVVPPSIAIHGRVRNASGSITDFSKVRIRLSPLDGRGYSPSMSPHPPREGYNRVTADGAFALEFSPGGARAPFGTVAPGRYYVDVDNLPTDTYVSAIKYGSKDALQTPMEVAGAEAGSLEITLSSPGGTITGTVTSASDQPVPDSQVVLLLESNPEGTRYETQQGFTDQGGAFSLSSLRPGRYRAVAWKRSTGDLYDREILKRLQDRGTTVVINNGTTANLRLRVIPNGN